MLSTGIAWEEGGLVSTDSVVWPVYESFNDEKVRRRLFASIAISVCSRPVPRLSLGPSIESAGL